MNSQEKLKVGEIIEFGIYDGDPIKWKIVDKNSNGYLLVSENIIEKMEFGNDNKYKDSKIRKWLNNDFLKNFTDEELKLINTHFDLNDKVFILSKDEIIKYFPNKEDRIKTYKKELRWYWTRTPFRDYFDRTIRINIDGSFDWGFVYDCGHGVVPALYLNSNICKSDLNNQNSNNNPMSELCKKLKKGFQDLVKIDEAIEEISRVVDKREITGETNDGNIRWYKNNGTTVQDLLKVTNTYLESFLAEQDKKETINESKENTENEEKPQIDMEYVKEYNEMIEDYKTDEEKELEKNCYVKILNDFYFQKDNVIKLMNEIAILQLISLKGLSKTLDKTGDLWDTLTNDEKKYINTFIMYNSLFDTTHIEIFDKFLTSIIQYSLENNKKTLMMKNYCQYYADLLEKYGLKSGLYFHCVGLYCQKLNQHKEAKEYFVKAYENDVKMMGEEKAYHSNASCSLRTDYNCDIELLKTKYGSYFL